MEDVGQKLPQLGHFIDGRIISCQNGRHGPVYNPANGVQQSQLNYAGPKEIEAAICAAEKAFPEWASLSPLRRARILMGYREILEENIGELAAIISSEHGKTLPDAKGELQRGIEVVEFACGIPHLLKGEFSDTVSAGMDSWSLRQPVGICLGITPFNFPAMVPMWMFPVALACGNTFILKPSEKDPSCPLRLAELFGQAGLPKGVLNVVNGDSKAANMLMTDNRIAAVSFVGSTNAARHIYASASENGKRVQALGGAKNHLVVMPDADIEQTADALVGAAYGSAGERCMAVSVVVAVGAAADKLAAALIPRIRQLRVGPGSGKDIDMGPLVTREHLERVVGYIDIGIAEGAELLVDGRECKVNSHEKGFYLGPTLFDRVTSSMRIYKEEIFGPVLSMVRVSDLEAAVEFVNNHEYGNGASIFTRSGESGRHFSHNVHAGMVGVNVAIPVPMAFHSFGGWKHSLFGTLHVHGQDGVRFYTRLKTVTARWEKNKGTPDSGFSIPALD